MTADRCRWDRDTDSYRTPAADQCDIPRTHHCQAKRSCGQHLEWGQQTCAVCLGRTRRHVRRIAEVTPLLMTAALETRRINSEAANLAGPAADVEAWSWRKVTAMQGRAWHLSRDEDDDERHPFTVLTRWAWLISNDYGGQTPDVWTISNAATYLDSVLHRVAHDEDQDWRQMASELKRCAGHLEAELRVAEFREKGAPCPTCKEAGKFVQLILEHGHWCTRAECTQQFHYLDDTGDVWRCPADHDHWWNPQGYADLLERRMGA